MRVVRSINFAVPHTRAVVVVAGLLPLVVVVHDGEHSEDEEDVLRGEGVQEALAAQGHAVQEGQGLALCARYVSLSLSLSRSACSNASIYLSVCPYETDLSLEMRTV